MNPLYSPLDNASVHNPFQELTMDENKSSNTPENSQIVPEPATISPKKSHKKKTNIKGVKNPYHHADFIPPPKPSKAGLNTLAKQGKLLSPGNPINGAAVEVLPLDSNAVSPHFRETVEKQLLNAYLEVGHARAQAFLETLLETGVHKRALEDTGLTWGVISGWQSCKPFRDVYECILAAIDVRRKRQARDALHTRAVDGVPEPVYQGGKLVGEVQRYSDKCLELELKGLDRETFGSAADDNAPKVAVQINIEGVPGVAAVNLSSTMPALPVETGSEQAITDAVQGMEDSSGTDTESV